MTTTFAAKYHLYFNAIGGAAEATSLFTLSAQ
jgi:hypothetical protein